MADVVVYLTLMAGSMFSLLRDIRVFYAEKIVVPGSSNPEDETQGNFSSDH